MVLRIEYDVFEVKIINFFFELALHILSFFQNLNYKIFQIIKKNVSELLSSATFFFNFRWGRVDIGSQTLCHLLWQWFKDLSIINVFRHPKTSHQISPNDFTKRHWYTTAIFWNKQSLFSFTIIGEWFWELNMMFLR